MMSNQQHVLKLFMSVGMSVVLSATLVNAQSGSLEPPGTAVNGSGDPVATTQTQPSWDQNLPANERFVLVMGGEGVLDKQTGLVWEQAPLETTQSWSGARFHCARRGVGGQMGWRLPSFHELSSLVVSGNPPGGPDLPVGNPFSNVQSDVYWSATTTVENPLGAWGVGFINGTVGTLLKSRSFFVWCVRGGGSLSEY